MLCHNSKDRKEGRELKAFRRILCMAGSQKEREKDRKVDHIFKNIHPLASLSVSVVGPIVWRLRGKGEWGGWRLRGKGVGGGMVEAGY